MDLQEFVAHFAEQFEETDASVFTPQTKYHELEEWSSLIGLSIIAMVDEEYDVAIKGNAARRLRRRQRRPSQHHRLWHPAGRFVKERA